ncbi:MAG: Crp/Fnr family transcriptional regulator [Geminicoccaceae bacterium]
MRSLSSADAALLRPDLVPVRLSQGEVLFEIGEPLTRVYLLEEGVVSMLSVSENGRSHRRPNLIGACEMATIGNEGVVGVAALVDGDSAMGRYVVLVPGAALAIEVGALRRAMRKSPTFRSLCAACVRAFLEQVLQSAACNSLHRVEERCARWLLMTHDRCHSDTFLLTQESLAAMLGVHRPTITHVARILQSEGLIRYSRGMITIVDRPGLEKAACECYRIIRRQQERLLSASTDPIRARPAARSSTTCA